MRRSLDGSLLRAMTPDALHRAKAPVHLRRFLRGNDFAGLEALFRAFFSGIPQQWRAKNDVARCEDCYASAFYPWFAASGLAVRVEESTIATRMPRRAPHQNRRWKRSSARLRR